MQRVLFPFHSTCFLQMISSQFKHPQVHVGDGVEGPAAQKDHFGYIVILHASFWG